MQVLDNQLELIYNSYVWTEDVVKKTCRKRWMIETNGERESGKSVLGAQHDDDDNLLSSYSWNLEFIWSDFESENQRIGKLKKMVIKATKYTKDSS